MRAFSLRSVTIYKLLSFSIFFFDTLFIFSFVVVVVDVKWSFEADFPSSHLFYKFTYITARSQNNKPTTHTNTYRQTERERETIWVE